MKKIIKPWGYEKLLENNKYYTLKSYLWKRKRCSLQFTKKEKYICSIGTIKNN